MIEKAFTNFLKNGQGHHTTLLFNKERSKQESHFEILMKWNFDLSLWKIYWLSPLCHGALSLVTRPLFWSWRVPSLKPILRKI
ncbi:unnamed protein product, partial [Larinioides sclopetarius]